MNSFDLTDSRAAPLAGRLRAVSRRIDLAPDRWIAWVVACVGTLALALLAAVLRGEPTPRGDDLIYERMASHPLATHTFPFGFRLGLPVAVHVLPFSHGISFLLLALSAAGGAGAFAFLLMRELDAPVRLAAGLAVLMCISPPFVIVILRHGRNTDVATVFFMMAATYFAVRRDRRGLAVALLLGAVTREAVLFIIPLAYALWTTRPLDWGAARAVLAAASPALLAYGVIRLGIRTVGEAQVPG